MSTRTPARTYNQNHIPRRYTSGKRRLSIYWTWSYPWESQRDPAAMENRFSTMTEVRTVKGTKEIAPLTAFRDIDKLGLLKNVPTLNFHPHLPHYEITEKDSKAIQLLARQPIDPDRPHPFTAAGNMEFNCLLWMPPNQQRAGDIVLVDSTNFTTLFGGTESLQNFWKNFALIK